MRRNQPARSVKIHTPKPSAAAAVGAPKMATCKNSTANESSSTITPSHATSTSATPTQTAVAPTPTSATANPIVNQEPATASATPTPTAVAPTPTCATANPIVNQEPATTIATPTQTAVATTASCATATAIRNQEHATTAATPNETAVQHTPRCATASTNHNRGQPTASADADAGPATTSATPTQTSVAPKPSRATASAIHNQVTPLNDSPQPNVAKFTAISTTPAPTTSSPSAPQPDTTALPAQSARATPPAQLTLTSTPAPGCALTLHTTAAPGQSTAAPVVKATGPVHMTVPRADIIVMTANMTSTTVASPAPNQPAVHTSSNAAALCNLLNNDLGTPAGSAAMHAAMHADNALVPIPRVNLGNRTTMTVAGQEGMPAGAIVHSNFSAFLDSAQGLNGFSRPLQTLRRNSFAHLPSRRFSAGGGRTVDSSRLDGRHGWVTIPVADLNFNRIVSESNVPRGDMLRFRLFIAESGRQNAINLWARFSVQHPWFAIPAGIVCERTFARDELEVLYVDCMDRLTEYANAMDGQDGLTVNVLPLVLLGDPLLSRWWNQPKAAAGIIREQDFAHRFGVFYAHDSLDHVLVGENMDQLRELYPGRPHWWSVEWFPVGVPCPMPPCVFYYHSRIRAALLDDNHAEHNFWYSVLELEYAALYAATWWHEAARGHRGFIIPEETIFWLEERLGALAIDPDTPHGPNGHTTVKWITSRMRQIRAVPSRFANRLTFPGTSLPPSFFIWTGYATGFPNLNEVGGRLFARSIQRGKIYERGVVQNQYGALPSINRRRPQPQRNPNNFREGEGPGQGGDDVQYWDRGDGWVDRGRRGWTRQERNEWDNDGRHRRDWRYDMAGEWEGRGERTNWNEEQDRAWNGYDWDMRDDDYGPVQRAPQRRALNDGRYIATNSADRYDDGNLRRHEDRNDGAWEYNQPGHGRDGYGGGRHLGAQPPIHQRDRRMPNCPERNDPYRARVDPYSARVDPYSAQQNHGGRQAPDNYGGGAQYAERVGREGGGQHFGYYGGGREDADRGGGGGTGQYFGGFSGAQR